MIGIIWEGEFVVVEGISQKGKNRVREHGQVWKVRKVDENKIMLESTDGKENWRWVDNLNDPDFELIRFVSNPDFL